MQLRMADRSIYPVELERSTRKSQNEGSIELLKFIDTIYQIVQIHFFSFFLIKNEAIAYNDLNVINIYYLHNCAKLRNYYL